MAFKSNNQCYNNNKTYNNNYYKNNNYNNKNTYSNEKTTSSISHPHQRNNNRYEETPNVNRNNYYDKNNQNSRYNQTRYPQQSNDQPKNQWQRRQYEETVDKKCAEKTCEKKIVFSRNDIIKLMNENNVIPNELVLPKIIELDIVENLSVDLFLIGDRNEGAFEKKTGETAKQVDLDWALGTKIVKLTHHDNGYVAPSLRSKEESISVDDLLVFERSMKTLLNKMTPENFEACVLEIKKLNIKTKETLECFVEQIFSKAILEESYCKIYSQLASKFSTLKINFSNNNRKSFLSLLFSKCKTMFESDLDKQCNDVKELWEEKIKKEQDERMKSLYKDSIDEKVNKVKDKYFGNMRFISELYLQNLVSNENLLDCVKSLLEQETNITCMEALSKMVQVVGQQLESNSPAELNRIFVKIVELSNSKQLPMKTRFKLKDVIDMKNRNWQLRQIQKITNIEPKTLQQLQNEK